LDHNYIFIVCPQFVIVEINGLSVKVSCEL